MEKVKKVAKYLVNILEIIGVLLIEINKVDGIAIPHSTIISEVIFTICGIISFYLLGQKFVKKYNGE